MRQASLLVAHGESERPHYDAACHALGASVAERCPDSLGTSSRLIEHPDGMLVEYGPDGRPGIFATAWILPTWNSPRSAALAVVRIGWAGTPPTVTALNGAPLCPHAVAA